MYARKTLTLYGLWIVKLCLEIMLRIALILCIPLILIWSSYGMKWNQNSAQASFDLSILLFKGWPKPPPTDWRLFFSLRRRRATESRAVSGEVLPPLDKIG